MVAEMHGVWASGNSDVKGQYVRINQIGKDRIELAHMNYWSPVMSPQEARYLAGRLNRLASKLEANNG